MPTKGLEKVRAQMKRTFDQISGPLTQRTILEILIAGGAEADIMTPIALGNLVNSRFREVVRKPNGWVGRYGYTAEYALFVHEASGKLKGKPRSSVASFNTRGGKAAFEHRQGNFWEPQGEPQFLLKGFEKKAMPVIRAIIKRNMQL